MRGGRSVKALAVLASLVTLAVSGAGQARPRADVNMYGEAGLIELPRASLIGVGRYSFGAWFNYYKHLDDQGLRASPVSFGLGLPFKLDLSFSFSNMDSGDPDARSTPIQLRSSIKRLLLPQPRFPLAVAVGLRLTNLLSSPDLEPVLLVDRSWSRFALVAMGGLRYATEPDRPYAVTFGGGAEYRPLDWLMVCAEASGSYVPQGGAKRLRIIAGSRWRLYKGLGVVVAGSAGLFGDAELRALVGIRFQPEGSGREDSDGDDIPDAVDLCPEQAEDRDGFQDVDGCPDPDNDGDGIPDIHDPTPGGVVAGVEQGLHRGPVLMRLKIPRAPIPVWIMKRPDAAAAPATPGAKKPARKPPPKRPAALPDHLGSTVGLKVPLLLPPWIAGLPGSAMLGTTVGFELPLRVPAWVTTPADQGPASGGYLGTTLGLKVPLLLPAWAIEPAPARPPGKASGADK